VSRDEYPGAQLPAYERPLLCAGLAVWRLRASLLAAIERAECYGQLEGVLWDRIPEHLGFLRAAATTRRLRPQVDVLIAADDVRQSRRGGSKVWGLTPAGRVRLARARKAGEALELPEAPQHRQWRQARATAACEIGWLRDQLRSALEREQSSLSDGQADPRAWLDHGERVQGRCLRLAAAYYCLHGWLEPDGAQPDIKALRGCVCTRVDAGGEGPCSWPGGGGVLGWASVLPWVCLGEAR
jgi:hypothetical protein